MIREILLGVHATAWLVVVLITAWRTGEVPAELWAVLPLGVGAIIGAFKADSVIRAPRPSDGHQTEDS
jgi:hypothetical protein